MNTGIFGEGFPYSNFHDLNMDWIIKIAKDFLDQYTHIQEIIEQGKTDIEELTTSGLEQLQDKADNLTELLQAWYDEHSEDIADELAEALTDLNEWYTQHSSDIANELAEAIATFNTNAYNKAAETIASIPDDYSTLSAKVESLLNTVYAFLGKYDYSMIRGIVSPSTGRTGETGTSTTSMRTNNKITLSIGDILTFDATKVVTLFNYDPSNDNYLGYETITTPHFISNNFYGYIVCDFEDATVPDSSVNIDYFSLKKYNALEYVSKLEQSIANKYILYPLDDGRLNNQGNILMSHKYAKCSQFVYILRGSHIKTNNNAITLRIAKYNTLNIVTPSDAFAWWRSQIPEYTFSESGWYRISAEYVDQTVVADDSIMNYVDGQIYTIINNAGIREVATESELQECANNPSLSKIIVKSNIVLTNPLIINRNNLEIEGNGHTLTSDGSLSYLVYITGNNVVLKDFTLSEALDDIVYIGGQGKVTISDCDISRSSTNDGIGTHGSCKAYIINCTIHDNYDEGISTHDTSWAYVYNCIAYKNGYALDTDTPNVGSLGGIHLGGSEMGTVIQCNTYNNYPNGIAFATLDAPWNTNSKSICKNNNSHNNYEAGIRFGGATNIEADGNMTWNNQYGMLFYKKSEHADSGYIGSNTIFEGGYTIWSGADGGLHFKP